MDALDKFLTFHIQELTADENIPVDLREIAARIGAVIEEREMIPEAVMEVRSGQFHIYLQSNFASLPGAAIRRRFSLAHEIGHTLFYERQNGIWKARKDAPKGERLEAACHKAAAMILVPSRVLNREIRQRELLNTPSIVELAGRFEVSLGVMLRRLTDFGTFENGWAPVLTRRNGQIFEIEYVAYPPWLKSHLSKPQIGTDFASWFRPTQNSDGILRRKLLDGDLEAIPFQVTDSKTIFEVRFRAS